MRSVDYSKELPFGPVQSSLNFHISPAYVLVSLNGTITAMKNLLFLIIKMGSDTIGL